MAKHAAIYASIWTDPDFLALPAGEQRMYLLLLSQGNLGHCGRIDLTLRRWAKLAPNTTDEQVDKWLTGLDAARFVLVDRDTEEALVRSRLRGDGVWRQPNLMKAAVKDAANLRSPRLRAALSDEVQRILAMDDVQAAVEADLRDLLAALGNPSENPLGNPSENPSSMGRGRGRVTEVSTDAPSPIPLPSTPTTLRVAADEVKPREDVEALCTLLADRMVANGCKRPAITTRWRTAARLLLDTDGRPLDEALDLIGWCQDDEFWRANVQSLPKFREKYDQLRMRRRGTRSVPQQQRRASAPYTAWNV